MHQKEVHLAAQETCVVCGKILASPKALKKHLVVHSDVTMECEICGLKFKHRRNHKRHLLRHTDLKLFPCAVCEKKFTSQTCRRIHMKTKHPQELKVFDAKGGLPKVKLPSAADLKAVYVFMAGLVKK